MCSLLSTSRMGSAGATRARMPILHRLANRAAGRDQGLTLTELMVVVAIIAILAVAVGWAMTRQDNHGAVTGLSQKVLVAMRQARATAASAGAVTQVWINSAGNQLQVVRASIAGLGPPTGSVWLTLTTEDAPNAARVQAVTGSAQQGVVANPGTAGLPAAITFQPDGSATAGTVYVRDEGSKYFAKVLVFGMTGYSHSLTRW